MKTVGIFNVTFDEMVFLFHISNVEKKNHLIKLHIKNTYGFHWGEYYPVSRSRVNALYYFHN